VISKFSAISSNLANELRLAEMSSTDALDEQSAVFELMDEQLVLHLLLDGKPDVLKFDLATGEVAIRASKVSKSNEVVAKAIGCKPHYRPKVLDATAGMGRDSLIMAMLGCLVVMQERNFAIHLLLENALQRFRQSLDFKQQVRDSLSLIKLDSIESMAVNDEIEVIYLDPMFPSRKKSALVKKEMRLFKRIAGEDQDSNQLLVAALKSSAKRVVVKRPKGAPLLAELKPSHEVHAKKFRYDVYLR